MGPVRSGKSSMMSIEIFRRSMQQRKQPDGLKRSRWAIVRNTYRELQDTTMRTWLDWWPEGVFGTMNRQEMIYTIQWRDIRADVMFRALDRPEHVRKLLSLELTGAWVNEAREIPLAIINALPDRVGQYPAKKDGGCAWFGVMLDTNPPDDSHWWYKFAEQETPQGWRFFRQPGGLIERAGRFESNPAAENIENLSEGHGYYLRRLEGKGADYVRVYYCAQYGFVQEGLPVQPDYVDATHCAPAPLEPVPRVPIIVGLDFGLTPAAVFVQKLLFGRYRVIDELVATNMGAKRFGTELSRYIQENYPNHKFKFAGDPAGDERSQADDRLTAYSVLRACGIDAYPVWTNDPGIRREALADPLRRLVDGRPAVELSPKCATLRKGLAGAWCYRRKQISGVSELYHNEPEKNAYSHVCEALEYAMIAAGEGKRVIQRDDDHQPLQETAVM
jgi:hypothetical protein